METSEPCGTLRVGYKVRLRQSLPLMCSPSWFHLTHSSMSQNISTEKPENWWLWIGVCILNSPSSGYYLLREQGGSRRAESLTRLVPPHEWEGVGAFLLGAARRVSEGHGLQHPISGRQDLLGQHMSKAMNSVLFKHVKEHSLSIELTYAFLKSADRRVPHGMSSN